MSPPPAGPSGSGGVPGPGLQPGVTPCARPRAAEGSLCPQAAERDWEEKRAALTQYSAKDINRLLEETQAELMKAIPDLEFAAKHKPAPGGGSAGSAASTPEHKPSKPQHGPKSGGKGDPNGRRGSGTGWGWRGSPPEGRMRGPGVVPVVARLT